MVVLTTITVTKNRAMKKILGCLIFIIGIWSYLSAQIKEYSQGSEFKECPMTRSVLNNLEVLCRVWGFVIRKKGLSETGYRRRVLSNTIIRCLVIRPQAQIMSFSNYCRRSQLLKNGNATKYCRTGSCH